MLLHRDSTVGQFNGDGQGRKAHISQSSLQAVCQRLMSSDSYVIKLALCIAELPEAAITSLGNYFTFAF
eukprot:6182324-Pleurochrysis_carterae.AAC.1